MPASKGTRIRTRGGIFYIVWPGNARGRSTGLRDRVQAETALGAFIAERDRGGDSAADGLTVRQALADYMAEHVAVKVVARRRQEQIQEHLEAFFGDRPVSRLDTGDIAGYLPWRRAGNGGCENPVKAADPTVRRELGMLTAAFNHAVRRRRLKRDQIPHVDLPNSSVPRDHWLTEEECDLLLRCCAPAEAGKLPRVYGFVAIATETGARRDSIEKLTWFQVSDGAINFAPPGHRQTAKRLPRVPISSRLLPVLQRLKAQAGDSSYVLGTSGSIRTPFATAVERAANALERAGKRDRATAMRQTTPHTLRHTWATLAMQSGVDPWQVAGVLGDTLTTVLRNYAHHSPDYLLSAVNFRSDRATGLTKLSKDGES